MSARESILNKVRAAHSVSADDAARRNAVQARLKNAPRGVIPSRGQLDPKARAELFCQMAEKLLATAQRVPKAQDVPAAVAAYLRDNNLPARLRIGSDPRLSAMPWAKHKAIEIKYGASDGDDMVGVSHAGSGIAETGTVLLTSGPDNPTTINFLADHHIVVLRADDIEADFETAIDKVRKAAGKGKMPRTVNFISGPSRSGDIEQKMILGAHGPRALHIIVVDR